MLLIVPFIGPKCLALSANRFVHRRKVEPIMISKTGAIADPIESTHFQTCSSKFFQILKRDGTNYLLDERHNSIYRHWSRLPENDQAAFSEHE
jgi:hypothetical protein